MTPWSGCLPTEPTPPPTLTRQQICPSHGDFVAPRDTRDRPLSFHWKVDYAALSGILALPRCRSRKGEQAMASIVYDAALSAREDPAQRISYSRRKAFYAASERYCGTGYGYDTVVPAVDALVEAGILVDHDKVRGGRSTGWQSSYRPSDRLATVVLPKASRDVGELIRLKDADGNLVAYRDTERTSRDRKFLQVVNQHIAAADIRLDAGVHDGRLIRFGRHAVNPDIRQLYRVFNGGWQLGGRLYGGWWQSIRARDRQHFRIDGGETCELDYEMLHPRLLYALAGHWLEDDAYALDGWERDICKRAFNILLNATGHRQALGAILPHVGDDRRAAVALVAEMKRRHPAVADRFHSGIGLWLQHVDSGMAKSVLLELTIRKGITVLPVHDSFIVRQEHKAELAEAMDRAFAKAVASVGNSPSRTATCVVNHPHRKDGAGRRPTDEATPSGARRIRQPIPTVPSLPVPAQPDSDCSNDSATLMSVAYSLASRDSVGVSLSRQATHQSGGSPAVPDEVNPPRARTIRPPAFLKRGSTAGERAELQRKELAWLAERPLDGPSRRQQRT